MSDIADNYGVSPSSAPGQGIKEAKKQGGVYNFLTGKVRIPKRKKLKARDRKGEYNFTIYFDDGTSVQAYHDTEFGGTFVQVDGSMKKLERYVEENNLTIDEEQTLPELRNNAPPVYRDYISAKMNEPAKTKGTEKTETKDPYEGMDLETAINEELKRVLQYYPNADQMTEDEIRAIREPIEKDIREQFKRRKKTSLINEDETSLVNQEDEEKYQVPRSGGLRFNAIG